jgi:septal ring factor EnvC (AmiA/AmiB activator)
VALRRALVAALLALAVSAGGARAADEQERARELEAVRRAIEDTRTRVAAFEGRERGLLDTLEGIDRAAQQHAHDAREAQRRARAARAEAEALARRERELAARRARTRRAMASRAVALYKTGELGPVRALFSAGSVQELMARSRALRVMLEHDQQLLARFEQDTAALEDARRELAAAASESEHQARLARARADALGAERDGKRQLLADVREDREAARAALAELEAAARALEDTLADLREQAPAAPPPPGADFASLRGALSPPVDAPVGRGFGLVVDEEFRTETFRKGVDFLAPAGTPVRAVAQGEVRYAGWFRGYGRIVILDHAGGYFTVSGHLEEIGVEVGQRVEASEPIGAVGETGSLSGPRLYFEIRHGAEPQDPALWLRGAP